ncbi:GDSL-like lipase/acylhydrolase [mine drainage metagenome]|uniref:GDSL-like lipase/acylhydrolase n=1 Tax=mine drainage metagenome TaxID=410659 RepID=A0A1J5R133_9ZZZZ
MRLFKLILALLVTAALTACGGGGSSGGDQNTKIKFTSEVVFGDSLSDVGSYAVGTVAALHGGKFTINTLTPSAQNWTELMAATLGLPAPCAAQTGLDGLAADGFAVPVVNHPGCTDYAQGGARVTLPDGPGNASLATALGGSAVLGQLTVPVVTQIQDHLAAVGGKFNGSEAVFVLAGANDVFVQLATLNVNATAAATAAVTAAVPAKVAADIAAGLCTPTDAQASNCVTQAIAELSPTVGAQAGAAYVSSTGAPAAVQAMGQAGAELAGYVNNLIVGNGAKYVTVVNIPDVGTTPFGDSLDAATLSLVNTMVSTFNAQLQAGLASDASVLLVDANTESHLNTQDPAQYGLTNVTTPACNLAPAANILASSLVCTTANENTGDVSHYLFADTVHPTPYGYSLLAKYVATQMAVKGWM